jgi:hypothetical protein
MTTPIEQPFAEAVQRMFLAPKALLGQAWLKNVSDSVLDGCSAPPCDPSTSIAGSTTCSKQMAARWSVY